MLNWIAFLFVGTLGWGISLSLIKLLLVSLTPNEIVLYRMAIGAITLFILAKILKLKVTNTRQLLIDGTVVGIFNMAVPFYLITFAEQSVSSSLASVINGLTPLFTFLLGISFFSTKQQLNIFNMMSVLLGFAGIVIVNFDFTLSSGSAVAILGLIITSLSYGIAANYLRFYAKTKEIILVAAVAATISTLVMLVLKLITNESLHWGLPDNRIQVLSLIWLGMVGSGMSFYLYCSLIQRMGAVTGTMVTYLMTLTGVTAGVLFLGEKISNITLVGCLCILLSLIFVNHAVQLQRLMRFFILKRKYRLIFKKDL